MSLCRLWNGIIVQVKKDAEAANRHVDELIDVNEEEKRNIFDLMIDKGLAKLPEPDPSTVVPLSRFKLMVKAYAGGLYGQRDRHHDVGATLQEDAAKDTVIECPPKKVKASGKRSKVAEV